MKKKSDATEELKRTKIYRELQAQFGVKKEPLLRLVVTNPATYKAMGKPL